MSPERLLQRIRINPDSGCWIWTGSFDIEGRQPRVNADGRNKPARRYVFEVFRRRLTDEQKAACGCGDHRCVAPLHTIVSTVQQCHQLATRRGAYAMTEARRQKIAMTKRASSTRMTMAKAEAMRADPRHADEVAAETGFHPSFVDKVRRQECWSKAL